MNKPKKALEVNKECGPFPIKGTVYCDNHTDVYVGNCRKITSKLLGKQSHPKPVDFKTEANCCDYVYFVAWSDDGVRNGFLAELSGSIKLHSGTNHWEVLPTKSDFDRKNPRPKVNEINSFLEAARCGDGWRPVFVGGPNDGSDQPFHKISAIDKEARFIWHDSGKDGRAKYPLYPYVPFDQIPGSPTPDHDEFLIFRFPVKALFPERCLKCECEKCDCCDECKNCDKKADIHEKELAKQAQGKNNVIPGSSNDNNLCRDKPYTQEECPLSELRNPKPCFYLHWGDSRSDQIETHDTEIIYITVCNPFSNVEFRGLRITDIDILPAQGLAPNGDEYIQIVPDKFICYDCIERCSCSSRELVLLTRGVKPGTYTINVSYCMDQTNSTGAQSGTTSFKINIVNS